MIPKHLLKNSNLAWRYREISSALRLKKELNNINTAFSSLECSGDYNNKRILVFTSVALFTDHLITEYVIALAFQKLGATVEFALCEQEMPICHAHDRYSCGYPVAAKKLKRVCDACSKSRTVFVDSAKCKVHTFKSSSLNVATDDQSTDEISGSGAIRYMASSMQDKSEHADEIRNLYSKSFRVSQTSIGKVIDEFQPTIIIGHHGIYVPQGVVNRVAFEKKIDYYSWHFGYRRSTLIFSKGNTYHKELLFAKPPNNSLSPGQKHRIKSYLASRKKGTEDWIHFNRDPSRSDVEFSNVRKRVCFFTSVDWDAALHFDNSVYNSQFEFLDDLINSVSKNENIDFYIRIHPAEQSGFHPSSYPITKYFEENIKEKYPNLHIIEASNKSSTYDIADEMDLCIVYNTKLAIELCASGKRTIVAGDAWVKNRGFTWDICKVDDLDRFLEIDNVEMASSEIEAALRFAYYFYFERCISTPEIKSSGAKFQIGFHKDALTLNSPVFDICRKILNKNDVITWNE